MPDTFRHARCLVLLELAEKIALEDPQRRKLRILHEDDCNWQVMLGTTPRGPYKDVVFPTLEQALEDFILHWPKPWLHE